MREFLSEPKLKKAVHAMKIISTNILHLKPLILKCRGVTKNEGLFRMMSTTNKTHQNFKAMYAMKSESTHFI